MNHPHSAKTIFEVVFGILFLAWVIVLVPSPLHNWFMNTDISQIPLPVIALALSIFLSPPFILSTILRKYDVDYDDEVQPANLDDIAIHAPM